VTQDGSAIIGGFYILFILLGFFVFYIGFIYPVSPENLSKINFLLDYQEKAIFSLIIFQT